MSTDGAMPDQYPGAVTGAPEGPAGAEPEAVFLRVRTEVLRVVVGREEPLEQLLDRACSAEGHALLEDVPGVGKTLLAAVTGRRSGLQFPPDPVHARCPALRHHRLERVQPAHDATSSSVPGPVFTQVLLADEINRATPRTQSALLEAMEEHQVTVDGQTTVLPEPFLVLATQNPIELEGTFPLPEAQLDRFLIRVTLGYPSVDDEHAILLRFEDDDPFSRLSPVITAEEVIATSTPAWAGDRQRPRPRLPGRARPRHA